jgi:type I restriction enzyme S subunit
MISDLRPYTDYKDSGLAWLGRVPRHWEVRRLRHLIKGRLTYGANAAAEFTNRDWPRYIRITDFRADGSLKADKFRSLPPSIARDYMVNPGDILLARSGATVGKAFLVVELTGAACHAGYLIRARPDPSLISSEFLFAFTQSAGFSAWKDSTFNTATIQNIGADKYANLSVAFPPSEEQAAIVRFLHWASGRLERAIRAKRKVIALLNERKQAIIHRAVTRGLDASVPFKPSGVPWLGNIPQHWEVRRSKYIYREVDNRSAAGRETHLSMSQKFGLILSSQIEEKRLVSESYAGAKLCEKGDLVLNRLKAHLGVFALAPERGLVSPDYTVLRPVQELEERYFEAVYRSPACRVELRKRAKGIVQGFWRLYTDDFYDIRVPVPPLNEQKGILAKLDLDLSGMNTPIARLEREIELSANTAPASSPMS